MKSPSENPARIARRITRAFREHKVELTLGGEPTFVPVHPEGDEWHITALGPTKLGFAYALADAIMDDVLPGAACIYTPGKIYPGEINPRWAVCLIENRDGSPLGSKWAGKDETKPDLEVVEALKSHVNERLRIQDHWLAAREPQPRRSRSSGVIAVLPLDHNGRRWISEAWRLGRSFTLQAADGPAGMRLPLHRLPAGTSRRALVLELRDGSLGVFLPPLRQKPFLLLLGILTRKLKALRVRSYQIQGYVPPDEARVWTRLNLAADPGVLEVNLPPCKDWLVYDRWLRNLEKCAHRAGLRSYKRLSPDQVMSSGGGNHLLFGGPSLERNPFFCRPGWVASMARYFQHHPSLAYLAIGKYVGGASQAPRADESTRSYADLEMAYRALERLGPGDHRYLICETLRNLHADDSGSSHRSEISFDKFWCPNGPEGSCAGLIEFRAIESLPEARWNSMVALLWLAIACRLLLKPFRKPLIRFGDKLHDRFLLPSLLWQDFESVLQDLAGHALHFSTDVFRSIWEWQYPRLLEFNNGPSQLEIRLAHESWPLVGDVPNAGGHTSRFVDTSLERLEFSASRAFGTAYRIFVNGREIFLTDFPNRRLGAGLRYRKTALFPSLHPCIAPQLPLVVAISHRDDPVPVCAWELASAGERFFRRRETTEDVELRASPCKLPAPHCVTYDLRIP